VLRKAAFRLSKRPIAGVYDRISVEMTPSEAMTRIHGVLNKLGYPNQEPMVEVAERIAFALGFECSPTKTEMSLNLEK
jgi:hypothetical protein